jgi:hypothetical protein
MVLKASGLSVNGTFVSSSDRNAKEHFESVDSRTVLKKVVSLPISEWNFKQDKPSRHIGPMAQDFHAAFGLGSDDKHIAMVDADGVALASIQGLHQMVTEQSEELLAKAKEIVALQKQLTAFEQRLAALEKTGAGTNKEFSSATSPSSEEGHQP